MSSEGVPSRDDLGFAGAGVAIIEDYQEEGVANTDFDQREGEPSSATLTFAADNEHPLAAGSSEGVVEGETVDEDKIRADRLRKARASHRAAAAAKSTLPLIPVSATYLPSSSSSSTSSSKSKANGLNRRRVPTRSCPQQWWRGFRICLQWRVLKHLIAASILPILSIIGLVIYFRMPSNISFSEALFRGDMPTVKYYLDSEHLSLNDPILNDAEGRAPLHLATLGNQTVLVKHLVFRGAELDVTDDNGFTPLHYAAHVNNFEAADFLISQGARVDATDVNQRTPLHIAAIGGHVPVLATLIFNGNANLRAMDVDRYLATDYSRALHSSSMQKLLDDGYYYSDQNEMKVISSDKFTAMQRREGVYVEKKQSKSPKKTSKKKKKSSSNASPSNVESSPGGDDDYMHLFTDSIDDAAANERRARRAKESANANAAHRHAAQELEALMETGEVDQDEFEV